MPRIRTDNDETDTTLLCDFSVSTLVVEWLAFIRCFRSLADALTHQTWGNSISSRVEVHNCNVLSDLGADHRVLLPCRLQEIANQLK